MTYVSSIGAVNRNVASGPSPPQLPVRSLGASAVVPLTDVGACRDRPAARGLRGGRAPGGKDRQRADDRRRRTGHGRRCAWPRGRCNAAISCRQHRCIRLPSRLRKCPRTCHVRGDAASGVFQINGRGRDAGFPAPLPRLIGLARAQSARAVPSRGHCAVQCPGLRLEALSRSLSGVHPHNQAAAAGQIRVVEARHLIKRQQDDPGRVEGAIPVVRIVEEAVAVLDEKA